MDKTWGPRRLSGPCQAKFFATRAARDVRSAVEAAFDNGKKRIHQLDGGSRPYRVTCPEGSGLRPKDGKRVAGQIQQASLCDQVKESTRESRVCRLVPRFAPSMTAARATWTRSLAGSRSRLRACAAVPAMPRVGRPHARRFLHWLFLSGPRCPGASAAPCQAWVPELLSQSRTAADVLAALPTAPAYHRARPVGSDRRQVGAQPFKACSGHKGLQAIRCCFSGLHKASVWGCGAAGQGSRKPA